MKKRIICILLTAVMLLTLIPITAFAADNYTITNRTPKSAKEMNHGYITVDETAAKGKTVKITVVPDEGYQLKSLTVAPKASTFKAVYDTAGGANTLTFYYDSNDHSGEGITVYENDTANFLFDGTKNSGAKWGYNGNRSSIKSVVIDASVADYKSLTSTAYMFQNMSIATSISGAEYLDVSNVTDMSYMFNGFGSGKNGSPTTLNVVPDVSKWNTGNVTNMCAMFESYGNFSSSLDKVPDVSGWNTGKVTNMAYMFQKYGHESQNFNAVPDVSKWDTSSVTNMANMFKEYGYKSTKLGTVPDVSNWNTGNVATMNSMFNGYGNSSTALTAVPVVSKWNTGKVTNMANMFYEYGYGSVDFVLDLSGWDLSKITGTNGNDVFNFNPKTFNVTIPAKTGEKSNESDKWYYGDGTNYITPPTGKTFTLPSAEPEYVEIGGLKWATKNLGAEKETDYGDYFAWGETAPYYEGTGGWPATPTWKSGKASGYAWQSYCGSSSFSEWSTPPYDATTKILKPEFDAAAQILGGGWRMPTSAEFKALYDACFNGSYDTTTNPSGASASVGKGVYLCTNYDGVAGCLFCDGTNKLFFPATGSSNGTSLSNAGSRGSYWSSSLYSDSIEGAYGLYFSSGIIKPQYYISRDFGFSVRPVKDVAPANKLLKSPAPKLLKGPAPVDPEPITPEKQNDGTYQFTMPDYNVTVTAEFEEVPAHSGELQKGVAATLENAGYKDYYKCSICGKLFEDEACKVEITNLDAWKAEGGNGYIAKLKPAPEPDPINYKVIEGANSVWTVSAGESPTFRSNADFSKFSHVLLDGKELAKKYYKAESGSTIITLTPEFTATLAVGKHTIEIVSTDGSASTVFYIEETIANTDGEGFALSTATMSSAFIGCNIVGLAVVFFELKKKKVK